MSSQLKLLLLLISLLPMAWLAITIQKRLPITTPELYYCILPEQQGVTWSLVSSHFAMAPNPKGVPRAVQLDLRTGTQSTLPFAFYQVLDRSPDGTVTIQQFKEPKPGIEIIQWSRDKKSSRTLWRVDRTLAVLNHRYLLSSQNNRFVAYDLTQSGSSQPEAIDICVDPQRVSIDELQVFEGTDKVLASRTLAPDSVAIYSLSDGQATEVTNWKTNGSTARALIRQGLIYSLSPDGLSLEVRDSQQFQVIDRLPLPPNIVGQWSTAICSQALVTIPSLQNSVHETYRLRDLSPIPELTGWTPYRLAYGNIGHQRFQLFSPPDGSRRKLLVYDALNSKIALEYDADYDYVQANVIGDDKLAVTDYRSGLTCQVIDLNTGSIEATYRPMLWPLLCTLTLNIAAIVWVIAWLRFSAQAGLAMVIDCLVIGAVIAAPMLYRAWTLTWMTAQPSMNVFHACCLLCMLAAGYNFWFGRSRIVFRMCICLFNLAAAAGLLQLREWVHWTSSPTAIATVWVHFLSVTLLSIVAMRIVTHTKIGASDLSRGQALKNNDASVRLGDLFLLTAVCALLIGSIMPMKVYLQSPLNLLKNSWPISVFTTISMTMAAGLFLSRWRIAAGLRALLVVVACLFVVGDWAVKLMDVRWLTSLSAIAIWWELIELACVCFLITAAWAWRLKTSASVSHSFERDKGLRI